jgi:hypothetical protein
LKHLIFIAALVVTMILANPATAARSAVQLSSSNLIVQKGQGWALVKPNVDAYKVMLQQANEQELFCWQSC